MKFIVMGRDFNEQHPHYRHDRHYGIDRICGHFEDEDQTQWFSATKVMRMIDRGEHSFVTQVGGEEAKIEVVEGHYGRYLRTNPDESRRDNLISLPSCRQAAEMAEMAEMAHAMIRLRNWV